jgi:acyl-coenzyme A synthetase/AMP-(fatty) acid ligase
MAEWRCGRAIPSGATHEGLLYFVGRDDAMIKTSGNRVSPTEVEEAAIESGLVAEACALGRKDERLGEAIVLFVRPLAQPMRRLWRAYEGRTSQFHAARRLCLAR